MDIVKNIICLENDRASVIRLKSDKLEFVKKDGEIDFPITLEFWDWWKKVVSYIDGDAVDICFVYDKKYDLLQDNKILDNNIINSEESVWRIEHIKSYFWELKPTYLHLAIVNPDNQEYILGSAESSNIRRFSTNLAFKIPKVTIEEDMECEGMRYEDMEYGKMEQVLEVQKGEYSKFARFFVDLINRERG